MNEPPIRVKLDDGDELIMQILVVRRKHGRSLAVRTDFTMDEGGALNAAAEWAVLRHIILGDRM